ncbi:MAG: hypothetical protein DRJ39_02305 [Thermoprotei archaeon]|nr:MAG: hypothetical protein DRJ39_02305 [Thermoprotei archaeon]
MKFFNFEGIEKTIHFLTGLTIAFIVLIFVLWQLFLGTHGIDLYLNTLTVLAAGAALWSSLQVMKKQKMILYRLLKTSWFYISLGLSFWLIAETLWLAYILFLGEPLKLSTADIAWTLGYFFVFLGLYKGIKPISSILKSSGLSSRMKLAYTIPLALGALLIALALAEVPEAIEEEGLITVFIDTSYVILDLLLLTLSIESVLFFYRSKITKGLYVFSIGLLLLTISDLPYFTIGGYYPGNLLDLLYVISYVVMAAGIYFYSRQPPVV